MKILYFYIVPVRKQLFMFEDKPIKTDRCRKPHITAWTNIPIFVVD